jgi:hypothetical protein
MRTIASLRNKREWKADPWGLAIDKAGYGGGADRFFSTLDDQSGVEKERAVVLMGINGEVYRHGDNSESNEHGPHITTSCA